MTLFYLLNRRVLTDNVINFHWFTKILLSVSWIAMALACQKNSYLREVNITNMCFVGNILKFDDRP